MALKGTSGDDTIDGTSGDDIILGLDGDDSLSGGDGDDRIVRGLGADTIWGGGASDVFSGAEGFTGRPGEVRYEYDAANDRTLVQMSVNQDPNAEHWFAVQGQVALTEADFVL